MQQTVEAEAIGVQRVGGQLTGDLAELLLNGLRNAHIKNALHQGLDREQVGVDVLEVADGLLECVLRRGLLGTSSGGGGRGRVNTRLRGGVLEILEDPTSQGAE